MRPTLLISILCLSFAAGQTRLKPVIRQIDHILIQSDNPRALFNFFTETLQLPVAWPIAENSGFTSGGVGLGNVNLEILRPAGGRAESRFAGLALEPIDLADCLLQLKARKIDFDPPAPYISKLPDGTEGTMWTTVTLSRLSRPGLSVFLCEYSPLYLHVEIRRNQLGGQLVLRKGGPLGLRSVREVVTSTPELAGDRAAWQSLLAGAPRTGGSLPAGNGPSIRLVPGSTLGIIRLILQVDFLDSAKEWLKQRQMLGVAQQDYVTISPSKIQGLNIRLTKEKN